MAYPTIEICKARGEGRLNQCWFLDKKSESNQHKDSCQNSHCPATLKPLINGKETFETLYDYLDKAEHSIDIAIWGFQPSMRFKREGNALSLGELLVQKAKQGVQIKVLVWSEWFDIQYLFEPNLGTKSRENTLQIKHQKEYDYWWYEAVKGRIGEYQDDRLAHINIEQTEDFSVHPYQFAELFAFSRSPERLNLQFKKRRVVRHLPDYPKESNLPFTTKFVLWVSPSHHQKTVLIDYVAPEKAVGFVLEHNMLDEYWDDNHHFSAEQKAQTQRTDDVPLQDVSALVTGQVLYDINHNFCQSWDRQSNINLPSIWDREAQRVYDTPLTPTREKYSPQHYPLHQDKGMPLQAQILRTYDSPQEEDIRKMYLQNIKKAAYFIYTENQYFRWPELVQEYQRHWAQLKARGRDITQSLYWFVVTNSTDNSFEKGSFNTYEMLRLLGREDVLPGIATQLDQDCQNNQDYRKYDEYHEKTQAIEKKLEKIRQGGLTHHQEYEEMKQEMQRLKALEQKEIQAQYEEMKQLKQDVSQTVGLRTHICCLTSPDAWQEVYIHSKVTIMDDVFTFIGSANLNTRSMQVDTELGMISECQAVSRQLRHQLWGLHTHNDADANPEKMDSFAKTEKVFKRWEKLMKRNFDTKVAGEKPLHPLCEFLRLTTDISRID